jgi:hypothetical protein
MVCELADVAVCPAPEILAAYAEHNLTPEEQALTEAHLVECWECRRTMALAVLSFN